MHVTRVVQRRLGQWVLSGVVLLSLGLACLLFPGTQAHAASAFNPVCTDPSYPTSRDPANPLLTAPAPPASDPLGGARFMVLGPTHGVAAGAIAQLLGQDTNQPLGFPLTDFPESESWTTFANQVASVLPSQPQSVQTQVALLEKIAVEPSAVRVSADTAHGSPAGIYVQTRRVFCDLLQADPGSVPIISTYFLHAVLGGCSNTAQIDAYAPTFKTQINAIAAAVHDNPAVFVAEADAVGSSACMAKLGSLGAWEALMKYEDLALEALPHTAVYIEGGYSDAETPAFAAKMLNAAGVRQIQGFFTNDTHLQWTSHELTYAEAVSRRTGGAHFIINTAANGRGPLLNPHPKTQGVEDLCNPPGRGLGIPDTTDPGLGPNLDALLWTSPPGNSSGSCNGGPPGGSFWVAGAERLAANANLQLGPGYPSRPY